MIETNNNPKYLEKSISENIVARSVHDKLIDDSNPVYSEKSDRREIIYALLDGKISMDMFREYIHNEVCDFPPSSHWVDRNNFDYMKYQIKKAVGFVRNLGIFEK